MLSGGLYVWVRVGANYIDTFPNKYVIGFSLDIDIQKLGILIGKSLL